MPIQCSSFYRSFAIKLKLNVDCSDFRFVHVNKIEMFSERIARFADVVKSFVNSDIYFFPLGEYTHTHENQLAFCLALQKKRTPEVSLSEFPYCNLTTVTLWYFQFEVFFRKKCSFHSWCAVNRQKQCDHFFTQTVVLFAINLKGVKTVEFLSHGLLLNMMLVLRKILQATKLNFIRPNTLQVKLVHPDETLFFLEYKKLWYFFGWFC